MWLLIVFFLVLGICRSAEHLHCKCRLEERELSVAASAALPRVPGIQAPCITTRHSGKPEAEIAKINLNQFDLYGWRTACRGLSFLNSSFLAPKTRTVNLKLTDTVFVNNAELKTLLRI